MNNLYENTWLYDLIHEKSPDSREVNFYERQIKRYGSPVLELACGTGNFLVTLSQNNVEISGLDISDDMLHAAGQKAENQNIETNLINADMRSFELDQRFALIFIAGNSLQHLLTLEDVEACFSSVRRHLKPQGRFIVEVFNPSLSLLSRSPHERFFVGEYETDNGPVIITENVRYEAETQINYLQWHYKNKFIGEEQTVSFSMRQFYPQELNALLAYNGFKIEQKFGNFDESKFTSNSDKQIVIARKA